jgi:hypothetical protein
MRGIHSAWQEWATDELEVQLLSTWPFSDGMATSHRNAQYFTHH